MLLPVFLTRGRGAIVPRELGVLHAELLMEDLFLEESPGWCQHRPWLQKHKSDDHNGSLRTISASCTNNKSNIT